LHHALRLPRSVWNDDVGASIVDLFFEFDLRATLLIELGLDHLFLLLLNDFALVSLVYLSFYGHLFDYFFEVCDRGLHCQVVKVHL
jgi:hypothetical protein